MFVWIFLQFLLVCHELDVMHCEKNILENIVKTTFGKKDYLAIWGGMEACNIQLHLHLRQEGLNPNKFYMLDTPYVLSSEDKAKVLWILKSLKTLTHYIGAFYTKNKRGKSSSLKSHDFHVHL